MHHLIARLRSFWSAVRGAARLEREMEEEMHFHLDQEADRLARERGFGAAEARRHARAAFGRTERYKEEGLQARGAARITGLSLDLKLGARMLAKYPGVTLVGGVAMVIGVGLGAGYLEVVNDVLRPTLPLHEGERVVGLQNWDPVENDPELRSLHDFVVWREELESVENLSAFSSVERNLGPDVGAAEPARGAEITASGFRVARVAPLLGRTLIDADEREGAPAVVVLGYDLWRSRFFGDPGIVGRTLRLDGSASTVVGVMPEGFAFPVSHQFWVPFPSHPLPYERRQGPAIQMFGRLAPGMGLEEARAELSALGARAAAEFPATHEHLRPRVVKYTELFVDRVTGGSGTGAYLVTLLFVLLLLVLASNVATMVFARTATRENEIAMRFALGASRRQILAQFFVEALVLSLAATVLALLIVGWGAEQITRFAWQIPAGYVPFWLESGRGLNPSTVLYAVALAVAASLVAGVLPALKATGARLQSRLRHAPGASESTYRFGGVWSAMTVVQVAFTVLVLPPSIIAIWALTEPGHVDPGFPGEEYLSAEVALDREGSPADSAAAAAFLSRFESVREELRRRLLAEPEVSRVTFATRIPVMDHPQPWLEVDSGGGAPAHAGGRWVNATSVDEDFFEAFGARIVAGRGFSAADQTPAGAVVIVNELFVDEMLGGRNAIGRRVRYTTRYGEREATGRGRDLPRPLMREPSRWYEIIGVASDLGMDTNKDPFYSGEAPGVYHPLAPEAMGTGGSYAVRMAFHVRGDAAAFAPRLREIAHAVHPGLRLNDVLPLDRPVDRSNRNERVISRFFSWGTALLALIAVLISTAGVYSLLSFTVARQTREIGIRVALGADRRRIVTGVFSRAMLRFGLGILAGYVFWLIILADELGGRGGALFLITTAVLMVVGAAACAVPVRRALRIQPTEALREEG